MPLRMKVATTSVKGILWNGIFHILHSSEFLHASIRPFEYLIHFSYRYNNEL